MNHIRSILAMAMASALFLGSCKKEENGSPSTNTPPAGSTLIDLFEANVEAATQTFTLNATTGGWVIGADGTKIWFSANGFLHADGSTVSGTVTVRLVEALSIGDMIWLNKRTVAIDGGSLSLLRSGGEISISATQAGETLRIVDNGALIRVPTSTPDPNMLAFVGSEDAGGNMIWDLLDSTTVSIDPDSSGIYYYTFESDSLQWINCDYFASYPSTTNITASTPAGQPNDSTILWIAFPTENAVMSLQPTAPQTYQTWQLVPVGMSAVVIGLYKSGPDYYSSFTPVTISTGMNVPMIFAPTTLAQFQADIDAI